MVSKTITVHCDVCSVWYEPSYIFLNVNKARAEAKRLGWSLVRQGNAINDLCPKCTKRQAAKARTPPTDEEIAEWVQKHFPKTRLASAAEIALSNPGIFAAAKHFGSRA